MTADERADDTARTRAAAQGRGAAGLLAVAVLAFVQVGVRGSALGVAWPSIRASFDLPLAALGPFLLLGVAGYVSTTAPGGRAATTLGIGPVLLVAWLLMGSVHWATSRAAGSAR
jgi:hypothetical protein